MMFAMRFKSRNKTLDAVFQVDEIISPEAFRGVCLWALGSEYIHGDKRAIWRFPHAVERNLWPEDGDCFVEAESFEELKGMYVEYFL